MVTATISAFLVTFIITMIKLEIRCITGPSKNSNQGLGIVHFRGSFSIGTLAKISLPTPETASLARTAIMIPRVRMEKTMSMKWKTELRRDDA